MRSKNFSLWILLAVLFQNTVHAMTFDENICFKKKFDVNLSRKIGPFGLGERSLRVRKNDCNLEIEYQAFQYNLNQWKIDICREPVHIKQGFESVEVIQKEDDCNNLENNSFCEKKNLILKLIKDEGLIFASGAREDFSSDHGKIFCSYLLLKYYLGGADAINRNVFFQGELLNKKSAAKNESFKSLENQKTKPSLFKKSKELFEF